ncbi:intraflagellar transport protein 52 homolog isoform X1 [Danaus plexippus]|uniref:intraflagellar transport protein 52 homolog isoform X1 n=1 Tax=Danaus plexippus TaxID=13037 RepID=UPI002AB04382|nr:intraflagellar transport protein 52 homolog isoform X1 [Danaus plexippus]
MKAVDTILFDVSKNEMFKINENMKLLHRKLKTAWKIMINRDELSASVLQDVRVLVIPGPQNVFNDDELALLKSVVERGDSVLVMMTDGGEERMNTNINFFLEEYGIVVNNDCVVRAKYHKFYHPKECHISNGILNRAVVKYLMKMPNYISESDDFLEDPPSPNFVYPYGATLTVKKPAVGILSSSDVCYPVKRPLAAMYTSEKSGGKLFVIGSGHFFTDHYLESECNDLIRELIFNHLGGMTELVLNPVDIEDPDVSEYRTLCDTLYLSLLSLPEPASCPPPRFTLHPHALVAWRLFSLNLSHLPEVLELYGELRIKHEPLRLIAPQFETPFPPLQLAVFSPTFRELPPPPLELFDLDEAFSSERTQLARILNKCIQPQTDRMAQGDNRQTESELEYLVRECGRAVRLTRALEDGPAVSVLHQLAVQVATFKKIAPRD